MDIIKAFLLNETVRFPAIASLRRSAYLLCMCLLALFLAGAAEPGADFSRITIDDNQPDDPWMKAIADLDNNGLADLIVCGRAGPIVWYQAPDWTRVTINTDIGEDGSTTGIATGDLDGDGDLDVILANGHWYRNPLPDASPAIGNWAHRQIGALPKGHDIRLHDLDGDGDLDAVVRDQGASGNSVRIYRQDSPTDWRSEQLPAPAGEGLTLGDLDSDGDADIIIGGYWYENPRDLVDGQCTRHSYTTEYTYEDVIVATGHINKDAWLDVVLVPAEPAGASYRISWFEGISDPAANTLTEHVIQEPQETVVHSLQLADVNNDAQTDIIFAEMQQGSDPHEVGIFINQAHGSGWLKEVVYQSGSHNIQAADLDRDGDIDFFGANWHSNDARDGGQINLWRNDADPKFSLDRWQRYVIDGARTWEAVFISSGDLNRDGLPDIIAGGWWYENPGLSLADWPRHDFSGMLNNMAAVYDFDQDGDLDVLGTGGKGRAADNTFYWARNDGNGNLTVLDNVAGGNGDFLQGAAVGAFDNDVISIALSWHQSGHGIQMLTVPASASAFVWPMGKISGTSLDEDLSTGDIDRDGDLDLLLGTKILRNDGAGIWTELTIDDSTDAHADRNELADIDGDGDLDVVVGFEAISISGQLVWYENPDSIEQTWPKHVIDTIIGPMSVDVGDLDRDGDMDVVAGEHNLSDPRSASLFVFENDNAGRTWQRHVVFTGDEHHDGAQLADIDSDGDLDIISIGWENNLVTLYENLAIDSGSPTVARPVVSPPGGIFNNAVQVAMGTITPQAEIRYTLDGSLPTMDDNLYQGPITIDHTLTLKARAFLEGYTNSAVADASFEFDDTSAQGNPPGAVSTGGGGCFIQLLN